MVYGLWLGCRAKGELGRVEGLGLRVYPVSGMKVRRSEPRQLSTCSPTSASPGLTVFPQVDTLAPRYKSVNFGAGKDSGKRSGDTE